MHKNAIKISQIEAVGHSDI